MSQTGVGKVVEQPLTDQNLVLGDIATGDGRSEAARTTGDDLGADARSRANQEKWSWAN
jgi:hypothetical protein